jgi:hypothetical protein
MEAVVGEGNRYFKHSINYVDINSWERLAKSRLLGFIQSRLYQGSWNLDDYDQNFELTYTSKSWLGTQSQYITDNMTVFNSTSFASNWLIRKFRTIKALKPAGEVRGK